MSQKVRQTILLRLPSFNFRPYLTATHHLFIKLKTKLPQALNNSEFIDCSDQYLC
jgi:hypothetical protein